MATNTQFSIAIHILAGLGHCPENTAISANLAHSVNTSPSFVRRILSKLSKARLVQTATGQGGSCRLARDPRDITLLDIYRAVGAPKAFALHNYAPERQCAVSCNIKYALESALEKTQRGMEGTLKKITLAEVLGNLKHPKPLKHPP